MEKNHVPSFSLLLSMRCSEPWLYVGPLDAGEEEVHWMSCRCPVYSRDGRANIIGSWMLQNAWVRPYYENAMLNNKWTTSGVTNFGRWDYPLGVTMYGLLRTGRQLERPDIVSYAAAHIQATTDRYEYSFWDRQQYGFPAINQQLVMMRMLDNCGSFGSAMLEAYAECEDPAFREIADHIADFITNRLERKEDGAFFRECFGDYSENTLWADDLYMSTPFLRRYSQITGDKRYLDEAAKQFLLFKKYLYMPEHQIMSHVFDFKYGQATQIPWGRGNGWSIFSFGAAGGISAGHPNREELIDFFNQLCAGLCRSAGGQWPMAQVQIIASGCIPRGFMYSDLFRFRFRQGVRLGWLSKPERYIKHLHSRLGKIQTQLMRLTATATYMVFAAVHVTPLLPNITKRIFDRCE